MVTDHAGDNSDLAQMLVILLSEVVINTVMFELWDG